MFFAESPRNTSHDLRNFPPEDEGTVVMQVDPVQISGLAGPTYTLRDARPTRMRSLNAVIGRSLAGCVHVTSEAGGWIDYGLSGNQVQTHKPYLVTFDLTDPGAVVAAAAEILQCFGYVDILVNNAGISYRGTIMDTTVDVDKRVMETNYFGPVALTKALLPSMIKRRQGHIVAISSIQGKISIPFRSAYAASKHATQAFFDCLRAEMEQYEIEVTVISPGYIHTNLSVNAITADGSRYGVMDTTTAQGRSPVEVAHDVLAAVGKKKKDVILADLLPSLAIYLRTLAPGLFFSLMASRARKERKSKNC
ncbi:dehydrogenase/reductase SDR family member 7B isoform X6 [Macaca fascicularis]|uniref:dehydrogenase/reductase SDR family member 7B isoform X6 n=1 Tax=Macaca fascicularis TaxID=9541 RepID=UPI0032B02AF4